LIRAANSGISAIVDPYGRILAKLPLGVEGVLDGGLPQTFGFSLLVWSPDSLLELNAEVGRATVRVSLFSRQYHSVHP
jgi:apolipoprotein N-acyltransferase